MRTYRIYTFLCIFNNISIDTCLRAYMHTYIFLTCIHHMCCLQILRTCLSTHKRFLRWSRKSWQVRLPPHTYIHSMFTPHLYTFTYCIDACVLTYHNRKHVIYIRTYVHTYVHIYILTYIHTGVTIEPYEQAISFLKSVRGNVWMDLKTANIALFK